MAKNKIDLEIVTSLKEKATNLSAAATKVGGEQGNKAKVELQKIFALLDKGANMTKTEMNSLSASIKKTTDILVKATASSLKMSNALKALNDQITKEEKALETAKNKSSAISRKNIKKDSSGQWSLRQSYADEYVKTQTNVLSSKGKKIQSYETLVKEAEQGNLSAQKVMADLEKQRLGFVKELTTLNETVDGLIRTLAKLRDEAEVEAKKAGGSAESLQINEEGIKMTGLVDQLKEQKEDAEDIEKTTTDIELETKALEKQSTTLGKAFKQFSIYAIAVRSARKALSEAVSTIKNLDKYLTEQAMVTGKTRAQTYELLKSYQDLASQTGATTREVAEISTQFIRQGKTTSEALKLTEAAISAAKVAGISATESVNYLTTALNGFQLSVNDAMKVSDKFASIASVSATSYEELATALSKVASQANLAGMSIDYTTALLAKGVETTREAPETIGTALKTIIARMRELTDYGETLDDSMDINNVETQLAYVGVALRDTNGELRSTEDVLNDLGAKWDLLNSNQQAAVAKALAGTRQQSRLIAMMTDYERVLELQEISERSAGATSAQMATYMEGMEAALNKVNVAWEKIITSITNSDTIINIIDGVANILDTIGSFLENDFVLITSIITISSLLLINLTKRIEMQKASNRLTLQENRENLKKQIVAKEIYKSGLESYKQKLLELKTEKKITYEDAKQALIDKDKTNDALATTLLSEKDYTINKEIAAVENEINKTQLETTGLQIQQTENSILLAQNTAGIQSSFANILSLLSPILGIMTIMNVLQKARIAGQRKEIVNTKIQTKEEKKKALAETYGMFAGVVSAFSEGGIPGVIAGIAIATALAAALGVGIAAATGAFGSSSKKTTEEVKGLSAEIYNLNKESTAINSATNSFEALDNKIIKTNKDLEEMNNILSEVADTLSDDVGKKEDIGFGKGVSAKDFYARYATATSDEKIKALKIIDKVNQERIREDYAKNIGILSRDTSWLTGSDTDSAVKRESMRNANNAFLYDAINSNSLSNSVRELTQSLIENMTVNEQWQLSLNPNRIEKLAKEVGSLKINVGETVEEVAAILGSDDYSLINQVDAYKEAYEKLDSVARESLKTFYQQYEVFRLMNDETLDFIDKSGLSIEKINQFGEAYKKLNAVQIDITQEQWSSLVTEEILPKLAETSGDIGYVIEELFDNELSKFNKGTEDFEKAYNVLVKSFGDLVEVGILNMGQNMESLYKTINNFYETASSWSSMSESDKSQFILDNAELFGGNAELLEAFESGNYAAIESALMRSDALQNKVSKRLAEIEQELLVEEQYIGEARNEAYIKYLKDQQKQLLNQTELFRADLQLLLDQENAQLEIYKEYLQSQQDALEESLNARKEAYEKYFDALNQQYEDENYEQDAERLMTNAAKLASSTDAASRAALIDIEAQMRQLEEERLQELRERAQQAVVEDIDNTINQIADELSKLTENEQELLDLMKQDIAGGGVNFAQAIIGNKLASGELTNLGMEDWIQNTFGAAFASILSGVDMENITATNNGGVFNLSVNDNPITFTQEETETLWTVLKQTLTQMGKR